MSERPWLSPPLAPASTRQPDRSRYGRAVHFPDAGSVEDLSRRQEAVREHLAQLLPRRQDRRRRRQRLGQIDAHEDHGRHRRRVQRRGAARRGHQDGLPRAGAAARRAAQRLGQRHRLVRGEAAGRPLQRGRRQTGRGLFRRADGGDDRAAGEDRRGRSVGHRLADRDGDGRAALPAGRLERRQPLGRREAPRGAGPPAALQARHASAGRAHQPPRRRVASPGCSTTWRTSPAA